MWYLPNGGIYNLRGPHHGFNPYPFRRDLLLPQSLAFFPLGAQAPLPAHATDANINPSPNQEENADIPEQENASHVHRDWSQSIDPRQYIRSPSPSPPSLSPRQDFTGSLTSTPGLGPIPRSSYSSLSLPSPLFPTSPRSSSRASAPASYDAGIDDILSVRGRTSWQDIPTQEQIRRVYEEMRREQIGIRSEDMDGKRTHQKRSPRISSSSSSGYYLSDTESNGTDEDWVVLDKEMEILQKQRDGLSELIEGVGRLQLRTIKKARKSWW